MPPSSFVSFLVVASLIGASRQAAPTLTPQLHPFAQEVFDYWTPERIARATPMNLLLDFGMDAVDVDTDVTNLTRNRKLRSRSLAVAKDHLPVLPFDHLEKAVGRLLFRGSGRGPADRTCSGTVIDDEGTEGRSFILTAAHCLCDPDTGIWNDMFMFVPWLDERTNKEDEFSFDRNCANDPYGCWVGQVPLVEHRYVTTRNPFRNRIPFDYGILVAPDEGFHRPGHLENLRNPECLDCVVPTLQINPGNPIPRTERYYVGYPDDEDPDLMYCSGLIEHATFSGETVWFILGCDLGDIGRGGASGGPGVMDLTGKGKVFSVVSARIGRQDGKPNLYGPQLGGYFQCIYKVAKTVPLPPKETKNPGRVVFEPDGDYSSLPYDCQLMGKNPPTPAPVTVFMDPHFRTWSGKRYDYMGACDLILLKAPNFGMNLTMNILIRTKNRYDYSYVQSAIIKIGEQYLEVASFGDYSLDGVSNAEMPNTIAGFGITHTQRPPHIHQFEIRLDDGETLDIRTYKDMVSISLDNTNDSRLRGSMGLFGDFDTGRWLSRNGTAMDENDPNSFAEEWQVRDEPMLFQVADHPQYPEKCIHPDPKKSLRRGKITRTKAERACADWNDDMKEDCIKDVMATGDLDLAAAVDH